MSEKPSIFTELKRRNVYKVAVAYAVVAWLSIQAASILVPTFEAPSWVMKVIVMAVALGFPIAVIYAWAFELTAEGIKHTEDVDPLAASTQGTAAGRVSKNRTWIYVTVIGAALSVGLFFMGRYTVREGSSGSPSSLSEKSIAVLPFDNQNRDPDTDYLCDGIPESIINSLSELPKLKVMSRNSVFHYKGKETDARTVAKELKVQTVLTGRLSQLGDALSIRVELINAEDNTQIWGQQYNRKLADVFAVQEEIAKEISEKLRSKLTGAERQQLAKRPTDNLRAFQYYMQSRRFAQRRTREDLLAAISYYEKAIDKDSHYALAYAGLSEAYSNLGLRGYIAPLEGRRKAEEASTKALALDENLAEAYATLGFSRIIFVPSDFAVGDHELRRAVELSPSLALAHQYLGVSLLRQGRFDGGLEEKMKARELDPLSSISARLVALSYYLKRDYGRAIWLLNRSEVFIRATRRGIQSAPIRASWSCAGR